MHVADACRDVAVAFVDGVDSGWEKNELARWLVGPCHQLSMLPFDCEDRVAICRSCGVLTFRERARVERDCGQHLGSGERARVEFIEMDSDDSDDDDGQVFELTSEM